MLEARTKPTATSRIAQFDILLLERAQAEDVDINLWGVYLAKDRGSGFPRADVVLHFKLYFLTLEIPSHPSQVR